MKKVRNILISILVMAGVIYFWSVAGFHVEKSIVYKTADGAELKGDLYLPNSSVKKPVVLVVHGGGWDSHAGDMGMICLKLVKSGFAVFNITYRLAPKSLYPKSVEDVRDASLWILKNAHKYNLDPSHLYGWGYSAGAHLILMVGLNPENHFKALVAGGTPANFLLWPKSPIVGKYIGAGLLEKPDVWKEASPVNHVTEKSPPVFLYHGEADKLVEIAQMYEMEDALKKKGVEVATHKVSLLSHIGVYVFSLKSINLGVEFLKKH